ncbi:MAG: hypothetical protein N2508_16335, partial [Anaerolineae bacterium]|nr:hypothetical protein [Anaerolineae bacterium]
SRPFHKNGSPRVKQKQYTLMRAYVGYVRLDTADQMNALKDLYDRMWLYIQPVPACNAPGRGEVQRCPPWASPQDARDRGNGQVGSGLALLPPEHII